MKKNYLIGRCLYLREKRSQKIRQIKKNVIDERIQIQGLIKDQFQSILQYRLIGSLIFIFTLAWSFNSKAQYCVASSTSTLDYTAAFSTTGATTNLSYSASSNPTNGYTDQTAQSLVSFPTQLINFSHTYVGGGHGLGIWVDWNNDLDFSDPGEQVFSQVISGTLLTGSVTVPVSTAAGNYRMRVRSQWNVAPTSACGSITWGTAVDYTLSIASLFNSPALTQSPGVPSCLTGSTLTATGTPGAGIAWYWQTTALGTSTTTPYTGPLTINSNGTYHIRAFDPVINYWAAATSIVVNNFPLATNPPTPIANINPSCAPTGSMLTVPAPSAGFEYYWQETNVGGTSNALNATTPYNATSTGTYYVAAYETATQCWSNTVGLLVTVGTVIPSNPLVLQTDYNYCIGTTSAEITANTTFASGSLTTTLAQGNGCGGGAMVDITANALPINLTSIDVVSGTSGAQTVAVYYKTGTYVGAETNAAAWTLLGSYSVTGAANTPINVDIADLTIPALTTYGIYVNYNAQYTNLSTTYSNSDLSITTGTGLCSLFGGLNAGRTFNGTFYYNSGVSGSLEWYNALTGGTVIGTGSPLETIGTTVLPNASSAGSYSFYASSYLDGCYSNSRELVTVYLGNVNVDLTAIPVSCNNGNDGAVLVSNVLCGTAPFTYSIDGGPFGPQTGMTVGTHTVILKDANGDDSGTYTVVIDDAPAPTAVTLSTITATTADISWTATGSETEWNVEWGATGFTPGTGTEIGSGVSSLTNYSITPLSPSTYYDVYVSANCGTGTTSGDWALLQVVTECGPITALPWTENFDNLSTLGTGIFPLCWIDENPGDWSTTSAAASTTTAGPLSGANYLRINWTSDATMWTPQFALAAGETYEFTFNWAGDGDAAWDGSVYVNETALFTGATMLGVKFVENGDATTLSYQEETYCFTPTISGTYTFGIKVIETGNNWYMSFDNFKLKQVVTVPGTDGSLSACQISGSVDLNSVITTTVTDGSWNFNLNPNAVDSMGMLNPLSIVNGTHQFYYISAGCAPDTTVATITVVQPSSAGNDGSIALCRNQPFNLLSGLTGNVDFGGVWTDPNAVVVPNGNAISSNIPGQHNFRYIVSNGVCPADTSKVVVNVQGCDYLGLEAIVFEGFSIYPNPTSDVVYIANSGSSEVFNYEVLDMNGRVILKADQTITGSATTQLDVSKVEIGVYLIRIFNEHAEKTFRIVKN